MKWTLLIVMLWSGEAVTMQTPMETYELCEAAVQKASIDLSLLKTELGPTDRVKPAIDIVASCLQTKN